MGLGFVRTGLHVAVQYTTGSVQVWPPPLHARQLALHCPMLSSRALQVLKGLNKTTRIAAMVPVSDFGAEAGSEAAQRDIVLLSR